MPSCSCYRCVDLLLRPDLCCLCVGRGTAGKPDFSLSAGRGRAVSRPAADGVRRVPRKGPATPTSRGGLLIRGQSTGADLAGLPLPDGCIDLVVSTASLHHLTDDSSVIVSPIGRCGPMAGSGSSNT